MRRSIPRLSVLSVLVVLLSSGCGNPGTANDLTGNYRADYEQAVEQLSLNADGTFVQEVRVKRDDRTFLAYGRWRYDSRNGDVTFSEGYLRVLDGFGKLNPSFPQDTKRLTIVSASTHFGRVRMNPYAGIFFEKADGK